MTLLRLLYGKLHLTGNETKSAVVSAFGRKFLSYTFHNAPDGSTKRGVADKAIKAFKAVIRDHTRRVIGRSVEEVGRGLRSYVLGWKAYFRLAQNQTLWRELDGWMRHRLRALQLKQWRRGPTIYRSLIKMGARPDLAHKVAANSRRWWRNSWKNLNRILTIEWADQLGMPKLS